ncbi:MAG TPA: HAD family phosphatase [Actinomycetota bacterium]|nr:HAD family phosphatase [Actinomycetota bacterium]
MRPQGLLLDYGGVLTTSESESFAAFCRQTGVDPRRLSSLIARAYTGVEPDGMIAELERGRVMEPEFERWLAAELSPGLEEPLDPIGLTARLFARVRPDDRMLRAVRLARSTGIRAVLLSNSWGAGDDQRRQADLFDAILISRDVGLRKPEQGIYVLAAERIGLPAKACLFVDDMADNVRGARAAGMVALLHRAAETTIRRLETAFGVRLR